MDGTNGTMKMMANLNLLMGLLALQLLLPLLLLPQVLMDLWVRLLLCDELGRLELQALGQLVYLALQPLLFVDLATLLVVQLMNSPWPTALCLGCCVASDCYSLRVCLQKTNETF